MDEVITPLEPEVALTVEEYPGNGRHPHLTEQTYLDSLLSLRDRTSAQLRAQESPTGRMSRLRSNRKPVVVQYGVVTRTKSRPSLDYCKNLRI